MTKQERKTELQEIKISPPLLLFNWENSKIQRLLSRLFRFLKLTFAKLIIEKHTGACSESRQLIKFKKNKVSD